MLGVRVLVPSLKSAISLAYTRQENSFGERSFNNGSRDAAFLDLKKILLIKKEKKEGIPSLDSVSGEKNASSSKSISVNREKRRQSDFYTTRSRFFSKTFPV